MRIGPKGELAGAINAYSINDNDQIFKAEEYQNLISRVPARRPAERFGWAMSRTCRGFGGGCSQCRTCERKAAVLIILFRQPGANIIGTVDRVYADAAGVEGLDLAGNQC